MRAGRLRHRLVIEHRVAGSPQRTPTGARDDAWTTLDTVWGSLEPLSGKRLEAAQATWPEATGESLVRYSADIYDADRDKAALRISYRGRYYPIGKVLNPDERNRELRLLWKEGSGRG